MKQIITSVIAAAVLLNVMFNTNDFTTKIIVLPFLVFAVSFGVKNVLIMLKKERWAHIFGKVYVTAFLIYWFGFLIYWDYVSFVDKRYMQILFSLPLWLGGVYFAYKRLFKKK